ncbi:uncharacterized protein ARMOST_06396 [Armillaria ostoyae]|uniref:Uncharacterized protein n=1 Tax=Armillaria ostoyae TaxID=47428 RepID=A0A284R2V0_ARMOS|nr:uncharacterized protein ARMOST_06396 [Armillaria ostoyae]
MGGYRFVIGVHPHEAKSYTPPVKSEILSRIDLVLDLFHLHFFIIQPPPPQVLPKSAHRLACYAWNLNTAELPE